MVLDIGCGTGLLSMLAARAGAEEVYGCELYEPLAQIAREVTALNCGDKIKARVTTPGRSVLLFHCIGVEFCRADALKKAFPHYCGSSRCWRISFCRRLDHWLQPTK